MSGHDGLVFATLDDAMRGLDRLGRSEPLPPEPAAVEVEVATARLRRAVRAVFERRPPSPTDGRGRPDERRARCAAVPRGAPGPGGHSS